MARLPRLALDGHAHWLIQRGLAGRPVFTDASDRADYLAALQEAAAHHRVKLHAVALLEGAVHLLATPPAAEALGRLMQSVGRRYVAAFHRRHGGSGTLWDGRYRCSVVEPGAPLLEVLCLIDGWAATDAATDGGPGSRSSGSGTAGTLRGWRVDPPELWALGNTPFEREAAWQRRVAEGLPGARAAALERTALGGWVIGSAAFAAEVAARLARPAAPRPRGRPPRPAGIRDA